MKTGPRIMGVLGSTRRRTRAGQQVTGEQIIRVLKEADAGAPTAEVCRLGPSTTGRLGGAVRGTGVNEARRLRQLEEENRRLKQLLAEATLNNHALRDLLRKNA